MQGMKGVGEGAVEAWFSVSWDESGYEWRIDPAIKRTKNNSEGLWYWQSVHTPCTKFGVG